jgi:hypothetical protein
MQLMTSEAADEDMHNRGNRFTSGDEEVCTLTPHQDSRDLWVGASLCER